MFTSSICNKYRSGFGWVRLLLSSLLQIPGASKAKTSPAIVLISVFLLSSLFIILQIMLFWLAHILLDFYSSDCGNPSSSWTEMTTLEVWSLLFLLPGVYLSVCCIPVCLTHLSSMSQVCVSCRCSEELHVADSCSISCLEWTEGIPQTGSQQEAPWA